MSEMTREEELACQAARGDQVALTLLLKKTKRDQHGYITGKLPAGLSGVIGADDIVQDTHVEVYRRIAGFQWQGTGSFGRWLRTIAIRRLRDAIRHHRRAKRGGGRQPAALNGAAREDSMIALIDMLAAPGKTPSRVVARDEAVSAVEKALESLNEDQRRAIMLVHLEGKPITEAAEAMARSERSVHGLLRRGLEKLREVLGRESKLLTVVQ